MAGEENSVLWWQPVRGLLTSIEWSYAVLWNLDVAARVLRWKEGWYNLQLKNPYDIDEPEKRQKAELFYKHCPSCSFALGVGYPGYAFLQGQHFWVPVNTRTLRKYSHDEHCAFLKSAGIKTMLCIPLQSGVLELGTEKLEFENRDIVREIESLVRGLQLPGQQQAHSSTPVDLIAEENHPQDSHLSSFFYLPVDEPGSDRGIGMPSSSSVQDFDPFSKFSAYSGVEGDSSSCLRMDPLTFQKDCTPLKFLHPEEQQRIPICAINPCTGTMMPTIHSSHSGMGLQANGTTWPMMDSTIGSDSFHAWIAALQEMSSMADLLKFQSNGPVSQNSDMSFQAVLEGQLNFDLSSFDSTTPMYTSEQDAMIASSSKHGFQHLSSSSESSMFSHELQGVRFRTDVSIAKELAEISNHASEYQVGQAEKVRTNTGGDPVDSVARQAYIQALDLHCQASDPQLPDSPLPSPSTSTSARTWKSCTRTDTSSKRSNHFSPESPDGRLPQVDPRTKRSRRETGRMWATEQEQEQEQRETSSRHSETLILVQHGNTLELGQASDRALPESGEQDPAAVQHKMAERRRRVKHNSLIQELRTLIPMAGRMDMAAVLQNTICYVQELQERVKKLEVDGLNHYSTEEKPNGIDQALDGSSMSSVNRVEIISDGEDRVNIEITKVNRSSTAVRVFSCMRNLEWDAISANVYTQGTQFHARFSATVAHEKGSKSRLTAEKVEELQSALESIV